MTSKNRVTCDGFMAPSPPPPPNHEVRGRGAVGSPPSWALRSRDRDRRVGQPRSPAARDWAPASIPRLEGMDEGE